MGEEANQFVEALKERAQKMTRNTHATSHILTILDGNRNDLNIFNKYGQMITTNIQVHAKKNIAADTRQMQNNDQLYRCLKNPLTSSGTSKIISETCKY